jgi:glyoxylate reductase
MPAIVVTAKLPVDIGAIVPGADVVRLDGVGDRSRLAAALADADAVIVLPHHPIDGGLLRGAARLRVVANCAVGVDNVDVKTASALGICVTNTPDVLTEATADLAFALLLAAARRVGEGERLVRSGAWRGWALDLLLGVDVAGQTLGIVGLGRIGRAVARRAAGFGMTILHTGGRPDNVAVGGTSVPRAVELDELLSVSDFVSLHCPLTPATRDLIDARALWKMKPTAVLVNTARGAIVDEDALAAALHEGRLFGAGLDVFRAEPAIHPRLLSCDRVVLAPHLGSATASVRKKMALSSVQAVRAVLAGERPVHLVDPAVWERRRGL